MSILGLLGVLFIGLKLTGFIAWSWWWVTLPFWGGFALFGIIAILGMFGFAGLALFGSHQPRGRSR